MVKKSLETGGRSAIISRFPYRRATSWPASSPVGAAPERRPTWARRLLHDDEARLREVLHQALSYDPSHDFIGVADPFAPAIAESGRESASNVFRVGGHEAIGV